MAAASLTPNPPPGFVLESAAGDIPPPPAGFDMEPQDIPKPPTGFEIEREPTAAELDALGSRFGVSSSPTPTAGPLSDITPLPKAPPELRDESKGFLNNLSARDLLNAPRHGAAAGAIKFAAGNTDAEKLRRRRALGQDVDPIEREFNAALESAYQAGGYDSSDYRKLDEAFQTYRKARDAQPEFDWAGIKAAYSADPGGFWAKMVKTMAADPELLLTPLGWRTLAGRAGAVAIKAGAGPALTTATKVAGGLTGATTTGAAVSAPVSVGLQLGESGKVDAARTARETAAGAAASSALAGLFAGLSATVKSLRNLKNRPGVDAQAVDSEIDDALKRAHEEAVKAGASPDEARTMTERAAVTEAVAVAEGDATQGRTTKITEAPAETRAGSGELLNPATMESPPTSERGTPSVERKAAAEEVTAQPATKQPADDLTVLQARLRDAQARGAKSRNGDIRSEWERVVADIENEIASHEKTVPESTRIDTAAHEAATSPRNDLPEPTEPMKRAGNYAKGHVTLNGLDISIENPKGSVRSGVDPDGKPWSNTMQSHYGYIKRTLAKDGDNVDVFLGPKAEDTDLPVFVVDQVNPKTRAFDENKVLIGYENEQAARAGYLANYAKDWQGLGKITATTLDDLKTFLKKGDAKKPFAQQTQTDANVPRVASNKTADQFTATNQRSVGAMEAETITPQTRLDAAMESITASAKRAGRDVADVTGGKAITFLDDLAKHSPTAKKLRDAMEYTEFSKEPIAPSYYERVSLKTGELIGRLENALEPLRGAFRRHIPKEINQRLVAILRGEKLPRTGGVKGIGEVGLKVRQILNDTRDYAKAQGIEVGFLPNYFPRVYKRDVLESDKGRTVFIKTLQRHGIDTAEADVIATKIVNTDGILMVERSARTERFDPAKPQEQPTPGRMLRDRARVNKNIETARTLSNIPDAELSPFLENNVPAVLVRYVTGVVRRAEYARVFGAGEGRLNAMIRDSIIEAAQAGRPMRPAEIKRIYDLADAMQSAYRPIQSRPGHTANTLMSSYQLIRTLPLATISSLSEPFLIVARGRLSALPKAIAETLKHTVHETIRVVFRKFPKADATKALEDIGLGLDAALSERLTASFGGEVTKVTNAFFKLNFLHQFTRFNRVLGNEVGKLMVERHLKDITKGVGERRAQQIRHELAELGVDASEGMAWIERGAPKNDPFFDTVKAAGLRFTNEVVMNPRPTNRPMWHSNPHYQLISQLKGYQTVFGNTTLKRWYDLLFNRGGYQGARNAVKIATVGILMTYTAMLGNEIREVIKYGPGGNPKFKDETPTRTIYRAMERAGFLGIFQFVSDAMFAHRFGSPAIAQLAGPAASQVNELIEATGKAAEGNARPLAREVANAIPIANVIPAVRRGITETIAPESRRDRRERR